MHCVFSRRCLVKRLYTLASIWRLCSFELYRRESDWKGINPMKYYRKIISAQGEVTKKVNLSIYLSKQRKVFGVISIPVTSLLLVGNVKKQLFDECSKFRVFRHLLSTVLIGYLLFFTQLDFQLFNRRQLAFEFFR